MKCQVCNCDTEVAVVFVKDGELIPVCYDCEPKYLDANPTAQYYVPTDDYCDSVGDMFNAGY